MAEDKKIIANEDLEKVNGGGYPIMKDEKKLQEEAESPLVQETGNDPFENKNGAFHFPP